MIEIKVDFGQCDANGTCAALMPDVFRIDEDGTLEQLKTPRSSDRDDDLEEVILCCPMGAISRSSNTVPTFELFAPNPRSPRWRASTGIDRGRQLRYAVLSYQLATGVLRNPRFANSALRLMEEFGINDGAVMVFELAASSCRTERNICACALPCPIHGPRDSAEYPFLPWIL